MAELAAAWEAAAHAEQIYPLDEGSNVKFVQRPERSAVYRRADHHLPGHADARALAVPAS